jgi:TonB family protein
MEIAMRWNIVLILAVILTPLGVQAQSAQNSPTMAGTQAAAYPNTSDGLQSLIGDILQAAKEKNVAQEQDLINSLLMPDGSTWFTEEYGPDFGASLAAAYERVRHDLPEEIKAVYEGNVKRGWTSPKVLRFADPESADSPVDHFLNCMDEIVPLYTTAFRGDRPAYMVSIVRGKNAFPMAGDLNGYFVYDRGGFRFIPMQILLRLPSERPVRIQLDMNVMRSKLINEVQAKIPEEAIRNHLSGQVVVELIVGVDGNIKESKVVEGNPILSAAVIEALKQWRFAPTTLDGDPVEVDLRVPYSIEVH